MQDRLFQTESLYSYLELEPYLVILFLVLSTWLFYKIFLKNVSLERHRNIEAQFKSVLKHFTFMSFLFLIFQLSLQNQADHAYLKRVTVYLGVFVFISGAIVLVKSSRLLVLQYLFLGSMQSGVPVLIVNIFSLILSLTIAFWGINHLFGVQVGPLLATSAALSVVLGLAMQDTLGNLFAGISLQIDKNFEIGDWIEFVNGIQKATGQVKEISWRSTTLVGLSDELIILPNRVMAMAQLSNFSPNQPIVRSHIFRIGFNDSVEKAKNLLEMAAAEVAEVRGIPAPYAYITETAESWVAIKLIYFIEDYGKQWVIGDKVQNRAYEVLRAQGIALAKNQIEIFKS